MLSPFLSVCHNRLQNASPHKKPTIRTPTDHPCTNEEPVSNRLMVSVNMLYLCASKCVHDWWSSRCQVVDFLLLLVYLFSHKRAVLDNSRTSSLCPFQSLLVVFVESVSTPKWSSSGFLKNHTVQFNWAKKVYLLSLQSTFEVKHGVTLPLVAQLNPLLFPTQTHRAWGSSVLTELVSYSNEQSDETLFTNVDTLTPRRNQMKDWLCPHTFPIFLTVADHFQNKCTTCILYWYSTE